VQYVIYSYIYYTHSLNGKKITTANLNSIHLSYLGSSFLTTVAVSDKTLACTPVYSLKLINVPFAFRLRAHLSLAEILSVAVVKDYLAKSMLVMTSCPSCAWSASVCKFVEVNVTQHNAWMFFRVYGFVLLVPVQQLCVLLLRTQDFELCFPFYLHLLCGISAVTLVSEHCCLSSALVIAFPCQITTLS